jgi:PTS system nitrogen regulatory IIA component
MMQISQYMDPDLITFIDTPSREDAIAILVDLLDNAGKLSDPPAFLHAIEERERIVTTGIGMGVAIPHAKLQDQTDFFIALAISKKGIDWNALDHAPVRIIFMIGGPEDKKTEYLRLLSSLTMVIKDEEMRKKLLTLNSKESIMQLFKS